MSADHAIAPAEGRPAATRIRPTVVEIRPASAADEGARPDTGSRSAWPEERVSQPTAPLPESRESADPEGAPEGGADHLDQIGSSWLATLCPMIGSLRQGVLFAAVGPADELVALASWPPAKAGPASDAPMRPQAIALVTTAADALEQGGSVVHVNRGEAEIPEVRVARPLRLPGHARAAVVVRLPIIPESQREAVAEVLGWGAQWLDLLTSRNDERRHGQSLGTLVGLEDAFDHPGFDAVALAVTTRLADELGFERVSLGCLGGSHVEVRALSASTAFSRRASFARSLETIMDEAAAAEAAIVWPPLVTPTSAVEHMSLPGTRHREHLADTGSGAACSVPLRAQGGRVFGVLTFERAAGEHIDADDFDACRAVGIALGPLLAAKRSKSRWRSLAGSGGRRGSLLRPLALAVVLATIAALAAVDGPYRIAAPATVEGQVQRAVVAPYDGFISEAFARAGDAVEAGAVLATLQDETLRLEEARIEGERDELTRHHRRALAEGDRSEAHVIESRIAQADSSLALIAGQIGRARLVAPFAGALVSGDLSRSLGAPVERGEVLFELAPLGEYRVTLEADERDVLALTPGQRGQLALSALPGSPLDIVVEKIAGASATAANTVFLVEARIEDPPATLRPGMAGVAKIGVERRSLIWIWSHRLVEWASLKLWVWQP